MTDINAAHNGGSLPMTSTPNVASRQQGAGYARLAAVAPPAPCLSVQSVTEIQSYSHIATRILRLPEVKARVGLCRASIYQRMAEGTFPKQISLGPRAVGWLEHEIEAWIAGRIQTSGRREGV